MDAGTVPIKLRERLGLEATGGLLHVLDPAQVEWRQDVVTLATERFERRLADVSAFRLKAEATQGRRLLPAADALGGKACGGE